VTTVSSGESSVKSLRSRTPEPPFCWQCKEALRRIREHLDGDSLLPFALLAYVALSENASDKNADEFTTLQSRLARLAGGISTRTLRRVLPILRELGVIDYTTPRLRGPVTFRLLSVRTISPNVETDSPNVRTGKKTAFQSYNRITREERREKTREEHTPQGERERSEVDSDRSEAGSERLNSSDSQNDSFSAFWKAYPKKRGKLAARKAWKKLKPPLPKVLETLAAFAASREWRKDNGQFIPYPASWLNAGGWDDEVAANKSKESFL
jgi:hypothetical protein